MLTAVLLASFAIQEATPPSSPVSDLPTGWTWAIEPQELPSWGQPHWEFGAGAVVLSPDYKSRGIVLRYVQCDDLKKTNGRSTEFQPVLIGENGIIEDQGAAGSSGSSECSIRFWNYPNTAPTDVKQVGLMRLNEDGRQLLSRKTLETAKSLNADVLPLPTIGEKLQLDLPTIGGGRAKIEELKGKFVLVDFWATWCTPCMKKMPKLKALAKKHADELAIVGIDMDRDVEKGKSKIVEEDLSWPQVSCVEATNGHPDLWHAATGIGAIPVIIIADRNGIVRWIGGSWGMEQALEDVMAGDEDHPAAG
jgi:thiol-disulfide isomerase/thioredoxin